MSGWVFVEQVILAVLLVAVFWQQRKATKLQQKLLEYDEDIYKRLRRLERRQ